jgi:DNA processing protein
MELSDNSLNVLALMTIKGIGKAWIRNYFSGNESIDSIVSTLSNTTKGEEEITPAHFKNTVSLINEEIQKHEKFIDGVVTYREETFPYIRGNVKNSEQPVAIFYRGDLSLLDKTNNNVTVIGLLNPDIEIEQVEKDVVAELVRNGATIVSGLALGCDSIAHRQALNSKGKTIAILPSPLHNILPTSNIKLAEEIVDQGGLLITEYLGNAKTRMELSGRYQERDRLQALFSDVVILTASYAKNDLGNDSGSRLAMQYASNYSVPRAIVYDPDIAIHNPKFDLNRQLIDEHNSDTVIINQQNLKSIVKELLMVSKGRKYNQPTQDRLF